MKIRTNIVLLIIIFLFSCDKDNNNSSNVFRYNEYSNISSLDPAFSSTLRNIWPCNQIFNGLVKMDKNLDVIPDIAIVDGMTKRVELEQKVDLSKFDIILNAKNPPGQITPSLFEAASKALHNDQTTCIEVEGEEDLAPIVIHLLAPIGTNVVYGQPNKGVVLRVTTLESKEQCRSLLSKFEVRD